MNGIRTACALLVGASTALCHPSPGTAETNAADDWSASLNIANSNAESQSLTFGLAEGATDGIDPALGEDILPPLPPTSDLFDARFAIADTDGSVTDIRGFSPSEVTWLIQIQPGESGDPVAVTWDPTTLPEFGSLRLEDVDSAGAQVSVDLRQQATISLAAGITELRIVFSPVDVQWTLNLDFANAGTGAETLTVGMALGATDGLDRDFGESDLPPLPPVSAFDARLQVLGTNGLSQDIREQDIGELGPTETIWTVNLQEGDGGFPLTVSWDPSELPLTGSLHLQDVAGGSLLDVDLRQQPSVDIADETVTQLQIVYTPKVLEWVVVLGIGNAGVDIAELRT